MTYSVCGGNDAARVLDGGTASRSGDLSLSDWSATTKLAASNRLTAAMDEEVGLRTIAEGAAETMMDLFGSRSVSIALLDPDGYRELVNVGKLGPGEVRFQAIRDGVMAAQASSGRRSTLVHGGGYVLWVPIETAGALRGRVVLVRENPMPTFTAEDADVAERLAKLLGMHLLQLLPTQPCVIDVLA